MKNSLSAYELFAGVGGFRLGLESAGIKVLWSNQWEPGKTRQLASDVYVRQFGEKGHANQDIKAVLDKVSLNEQELPEADLLVGGFPCQDYSVAKVLPDSQGIEGKKGVLWWEIHRLLVLRKPRYLLLENVDRLLSSPVNQRGRDFAVMISSLGFLGYEVEWRIVNSADYGSHQRRKRIFIFASLEIGNSNARLFETGESVLSRAFPIASRGSISSLEIGTDVQDVSQNFNSSNRPKPFENSGASHSEGTITANSIPLTEYRRTLGEILKQGKEIPEDFWLSGDSYPKWEYAKGAKEIIRVSKSTGYEYLYKEGAMSFPDALDKPSRTVVTGEGGSGPSRFKHVVEQDGRLRRLVPVELERLNGFPDEWTRVGISGHELSGVQRAFLMGNALVVPIVERIARAISRWHEAQ